MIVSPKFRGFICTTAHPVGCKYNVDSQIKYVVDKGSIKGAQKVLVIGASAGYGLASRIVSAFGFGASTIGVSFEKESNGKRTATAGWYNTQAFEKAANEAGIYAKSINGDAFSDDIKSKAIELIKADLGKVDLVVYSLASPRRQHPKTGEIFNSVLKPIDSEYKSKTVDFHTGEVTDILIESANEDEIRQTVEVMGGEDWKMWIDALNEAGVLSENVKTVAYSYIGPELTHAIYRAGTIGRAKDHLEETADVITSSLEKLGGKALVSVNKALVTQASSAIPVVPLYISLLFKVMKEKGIHEGCIEQMYRLFSENLYSDKLELDNKGRIRIDDLEMREDVQTEVCDLWDTINTENLKEMTDIEGFRSDFFNLFGFGFDEVNYEADVDIENV